MSLLRDKTIEQYDAYRRDVGEEILGDTAKYFGLMIRLGNQFKADFVDFFFNVLIYAFLRN